MHINTPTLVLLSISILGTAMGHPGMAPAEHAEGELEARQIFSYTGVRHSLTHTL